MVVVAWVVSRPSSAAHTAVKMPQAARVPEDRWTMTVLSKVFVAPLKTREKKPVCGLVVVSGMCVRCERYRCAKGDAGWRV